MQSSCPSVEECKTILEKIAKHLKRATAEPDRGFVWLSLEDANYLLKGLNSYLQASRVERSRNSLDAAFGVSARRGAAPKKATPVQIAIARDVIFRSETWKELEDKHDMSQREMRALAERHQDAVFLEVGKELAESILQK